MACARILTATSGPAPAGAARALTVCTSSLPMDNASDKSFCLKLSATYVSVGRSEIVCSSQPVNRCMQSTSKLRAHTLPDTIYRTGSVATALNYENEYDTNPN